MVVATTTNFCTGCHNHDKRRRARLPPRARTSTGKVGPGGVWVPGGPPGLQNRCAALSVAGGFDSRPPPLPARTQGQTRTFPPTITNVVSGGPGGQDGPGRLVASRVKRGVVAELNEPDFVAVPGGAFRATVSKGVPETVPGLCLYTIVVGAIGVPVVFQVIVTSIRPTTSGPSKFAQELPMEPR